MEVTGSQSRSIAVKALFVLAGGLIFVGILGFSQQASAASVSLKFDNGRLSLGTLLADQTVLPASSTFPSDSLPTPQRTDIELIGTENNGALEFPAGLNTGTQFPYMGMDHPIEDLKIPVTFRLNEPGLTGGYDPATGAMTLSGTIDVIVITGTGTTFPVPDGLGDTANPPLGLFARCRIPDVPVSFSSGEGLPYSGSPFADGLSGNGSIATSWRQFGPAESENGGDCETLNAIAFGFGGIWLANGIADTQPGSLPTPTCADDPRLCPKPEPDRAAEISKLRVLPKRRAVKAGKRYFVRVRVSNSGDADAVGLRVRLRSSNRKVKVRKRIKMNVPAGSRASRRVPVKVRGRARGKARIKAKVAGLRSKSKVRIKAKKKRVAKKRAG